MIVHVIAVALLGLAVIVWVPVVCVLVAGWALGYLDPDPPPEHGNPRNKGG